MAEELRKLRTSRQIPAKEMVSVVRVLYPKYDKTMQSKCERGDEYGIQIRRDAMDALITKFAPEQLGTIKQKKGDRHKLSCRISCRLYDDEHSELLGYIKEDGFDTTQAWLAQYTRQYINRKRKAKERRQNK